MESSWRQNVPDLGFAGRYRLIARLLVPVEGYEYAVQTYEGQPAIVVGTPTDFGEVYGMAFTILGLSDLKFPWGLPVFPDPI